MAGCSGRFTKVAKSLLRAYHTHNLIDDTQPDPEGFSIGIHRLSRFLSRLALFAAIIGVCVYHYQYPRVGVEGVLFLSSTAVALALLAATLSLALAGYLLLRRKPPKPTNPIVISILSIGIALTYVWAV